MQRLYFLVPDADRALKITNELAGMGLKKDDVHVVGRDAAKMEDMGLHRASILQTSDVVNATKRGIIWGVPVGVVLGIIAAILLPIGGGWLGVALLLIGAAIFGGLFGSWASSMVGVSVLDVKVAKFQRDLDRGAYLMLVDVAPEREDKISASIKDHFPEVVIEKITPADKKHGGEGA